MDVDYWCNWWNYSYEDYRDCDCSGCADYWDGICIHEGSWEYLNDVFSNHQTITTSRSWRRLENNNIVIGKMIDMNSIYSKERLREKKINQILGLESASYLQKPTVGDFFPK